MEPYIAIGALVVAWLLGVSLAYSNFKHLQATKQERLEARRAYKKIKNENLRRFYGLKKRSD